MSEQQGVESIVENDVQPDVVDIISDSEIVQEPVVSNVVLQPAESNFIPNVQSFFHLHVYALPDWSGRWGSLGRVNPGFG